MSESPVIRVSASEELLAQLLESRAALVRSNRRRPAQEEARMVELDGLIMAVQAARIKAHKELALALQPPK